jgi:hypothetical protein
MARKLVLFVMLPAVILLAGQWIFLQRTVQAQQASQATAQNKAERIAIPDLKKKLDSGEKLLLIDVREDWELKADGAIPGAIHIPVAELDARMKDIPKNVQIVFY